METTEYPIVSTEERDILNTNIWSIKAKIINLQTCKVVTMTINRKSNVSVTTSWQQILAPSVFPSGTLPTGTLYGGDVLHGVTCELGQGNGLRIIASSNKSTTFVTHFTYVII